MSNIHVPADFTLDELVEFIEGGVGDNVPDGYMSCKELAAHFNVGVRKMREILQQARDAGRLEVAYKMASALDGKPYKVPIYAFTKGEESGDI